MPGLNDIAKEAGLNPVKVTEEVKEGRRKNVDTTEQLEKLFELIIQRCSEGETVRIKNFGTFRMRTMKGRTLKSPLMEGGQITFPDTQVLRFHQSTVAKKLLNELSPAVKSDGEKKAKKKVGKKKGKKG